MSEALRVHEFPWPGKNDCIKSCHLQAFVGDEREAGQCGLEVIHCTEDGLIDDAAAKGVRPRPILSGTLYVSNGHRRKGVAQRLLREAEGRARRWGYGEMLLMVQRKNKAALALYDKMGYKRVAAPTSYHGSQVCLRRYLYNPDMHTVRVDPCAFEFARSTHLPPSPQPICSSPVRQSMLPQRTVI